jgi:hypothetical protein
VLVGGQVLYQHFIAGSLNYVTERHAASQPQIHWYNLRQFTPFLTKAIPGANRLPFPEKATDLLLLLGLTVGCLVVLSEARKTTTYARQVLYTWLWVAFLAFWLNILFMVFLSLRYPPEQWGPWTYVQEVRYFGLNMAISCSLLMLVLFWKYRAIPKYLQYGLKAIALVIFAQGYAFGTFKYRVNEPIAPNEGLQIAAVMKHWVENSPGRVVLATDQVHNYWGNGDLVASMAIYGAIGGASICHIEPFIRSHYCSEPVTVLVALVYNTPPPGLDQLYREGNARQVGTVGKGIPLMRLSFPATAPAPSALFDTKATLR